MRKFLWSSAALVGVLAWAVPAQASSLLPGQDITATVSSNTLGTLVADTGVKTFNFGSTPNKGTYEERVYIDTVTGKLDFVLNFSVTSGIIEHLSTSSFANFTTDVGYLNDGNIAPNDISRSSIAGDNGATVEFNFKAGIGVTSGQSADTMIIKTNATMIDPGEIGLIDGTSSPPLAGFAPALPEPSSLALLATGALGLGGYTWRRHRLALLQG
jgi:hypothetical protein